MCSPCSFCNRLSSLQRLLVGRVHGLQRMYKNRGVPSNRLYDDVKLLEVSGPAFQRWVTGRVRCRPPARMRCVDPCDFCAPFILPFQEQIIIVVFSNEVSCDPVCDPTRHRQNRGAPKWLGRLPTEYIRSYRGVRDISRSNRRRSNGGRWKRRAQFRSTSLLVISVTLLGDCG